MMDPSQLNELLECSVCLERLDHTSKVLPCQHTFCRRCLKEIIERRKELRCPECRVLVEGDVDELPTNILLVRILEGLKTHKRNRRSLDSDGVESQNRRNTSNQNLPGKVVKACARALYNYDPKEQGDLMLRKGEQVKLIRQVDENWYEGEVNGAQGYLPANYVEIITPLPSLDDTCPGAVAKALYDFEDEKEPDLLTFKQGDIIKVIRSVDENWGEGVLNNNLGIFPLSFVELNGLAKTRIENGEQSPLDELSTTSEADDSGASQPSPVSNNSRESKRHTIHFEQNRDEETSPRSRLPHRHSLEISSSERLAETYSRGCTSPLRRSPRDGSLTTAAAAAAAADANYRPKSVSPSSEQSCSAAQPSANNSSNPSRRSSEEVNELLAPSGRASAEGSPTLTDSAKPGVRSSSLRRSPPTEARKNSRPTSAELEKDLHIALFNYKPQKEDEIELVKGTTYYVLEKCKDGWFRGYSANTQRRGVFPGNYVRLSSIHNLLTRARSNSGGQELADPVPSQQQQQQQQQHNQRRDRNSTGSIATKPKYRRSESAPPCPAVPVESLVVNLDSRDSENRLSSRATGETSGRPIQHPALPPLPAPKTSSFWKKLTGKKKEKPPKPLPPPPYHRFAPAGHSQLSFGPQANALHGALPSYSQATREESRGHNTSRQRQRVENAPARERYRVNVAYPAQNEAELELRVGDIVYVARKRQDGWYKGTLERNGKTGIFPGSFVDLF